MYARTYACPGATDFFLFIYFHTEVRKAIRSMNLLSTFVFLFVCTCICVCVRVLYVCGFYNYFSHLSIVPWLLLLFQSFGSPIPFCPIIIRSLTFSLLDHSTPVLPRIPRFFHFWFIPSSPRSFRVTKIIRRHVRVRGIERYEEEGFEGLGSRRVAER